MDKEGRVCRMDPLWVTERPSRYRHLTRPITNNEMEAVIKSLESMRSAGPDGFAMEFYKTFKEQIILAFFKLR